MVVAIIITSIFGQTKSKSIILELERLINQESSSAVYIMRDDCSYCNLNKTNMELISTYGLDYYNINTNDLTSDDLATLANMLGIDPNNFGTPDFYAVGNGKVIDGISGYTAFPDLFEFSKNQKLISDDSKLYLNYIDYSEYKKLIKSDTNEVVILASSTCTYCQAEHPILSEIAKETGAKINYMYLDRVITSQEEYDKFMSSMSWFSANSDFGTPTTLIVKNKEVVAELSGYRTKDEMISFFKDNGIIK